jgi:predicted transcriptional regulator
MLADDFEDVQALLEDHFLEVTVVDDLEQFCIVKRKYTDHSDVLFKASVLKHTQQNYNVFLMKDQLSVEQAVNNGATRLKDTDLNIDHL